MYFWTESTKPLSYCIQSYVIIIIIIIIIIIVCCDKKHFSYTKKSSNLKNENLKNKTFKNRHFALLMRKCKKKKNILHGENNTKHSPF